VGQTRVLLLRQHLHGDVRTSSQVPAAEQSLSAQDECPSGSAGYLGVPDEYLPGGSLPRRASYDAAASASRQSRNTRPGRALVYAPASNTTTPLTTVAT